MPEWIDKLIDNIYGALAVSATWFGFWITGRRSKAEQAIRKADSVQASTEALIEGLALRVDRQSARIDTLERRQRRDADYIAELREHIYQRKPPPPPAYPPATGQIKIP